MVILVAFFSVMAGICLREFLLQREAGDVKSGIVGAVVFFLAVALCGGIAAEKADRESDERLHTRIEEKAYQDGYDNGFEEGCEEGYHVGVVEGYSCGWDDRENGCVYDPHD